MIQRNDNRKQLDAIWLAYGVALGVGAGVLIVALGAAAVVGVLG